MWRKNTLILSGKELSVVVQKRVSEQCLSFFKKFGRKPCLAVVLVGNNPASQVYVRNKKKACEEWGFDYLDIAMDETTTQENLINQVRQLNENPSVDGILVQLPLPKHICENEVINSISEEKDVDGFSPSNIGKLLLGQKTLVACTPKGIMRILDYYKIETQGKHVCVIGRSNIVGKPVAALLLQKNRNATVTVCHSYTKNLESIVKQADIVIAALGKAEFVTADMIKEGAVVIDVGINRVPDSSKKSGYAIKGDVEFKTVSEKASAITPVPGGVGPMTIAMLMENTLIAACNQKGVEVDSL